MGRPYDLSAWRAPGGLRDRTLQREPFCRFCKARGRVTAATVADHITPHRGDLELFLDPDNTQGLCKPCHDGQKQREERGGRPPVGVDGWPVV